MKRRAGLGLVIALMMAGMTPAQESPTLPDFSSSAAVLAPASPRAGDVIEYEIAVVNTGGPAAAAFVSSAIPHAYLVGLGAGCSEAVLDPQSRKLAWYEGPFGAGERKVCRIRLLTRKDAAGTMATVDTAIQTFNPEAYWRFSATAEITGVPDPHGVRVGPYLVSRAGLAVLSFLLLFLLGLPILRAQGARGAGSLASPARAWAVFVFSLGCLFLFASLAQDDYRAATAFQETRCTVVDQELSSRAVSGTRTAPDTQVHNARFALRYEADGREIFSSGFGSPTRLSFGSSESAVRDLARFQVGSTHPCWYDPEDLKMVMLDRSPGGAYLFALIPLLTLALSLWLLRGAWKN